MSTATEPKSVKVTTAVGTASFPTLDKPDTKFSPEGSYKAPVILSEADAAPIIATIEKVTEAMIAFTEARLNAAIEAEKDGTKKGKLKKELAGLKSADQPIRPVYDDTGAETGDLVLNFKMRAERKDRKTGATIKMAPQLFDAAGNKLPPTTVWGGSRYKVAGLVCPFYTPLVGVGVSLRLQAVQIIELRSDSSQTADGYGFGKEDGYVAPAAEAGFGEGAATTGADDDVDF